MLLEGKSAIVTGAGSGVGRASALRFAEEGAKVVCAARSDTTSADGLPGTIHETVDAIRASGGTALAVKCDIGEPADIEHLVATTIDEFGRVDSLINNAITSTRAAFAESTVDEWDFSMRVNVRSLYLFCQAVVPHMQRQGGGSIVNISSVMAILGRASVAGYVSAKHGLIGLTKNLAAEYGPHATADAIAPGTELEVQVREPATCHRLTVQQICGATASRSARTRR